MICDSQERNVVLSVGRIYCDLVFTGAGRMPTLGSEVFARELEIKAGGGAFIAAAHFAHAGRPTALVARIGTDALAHAIDGELERGGIDLRFLERSPDAGPQVTAVIVKSGERAFLSHRAGAAEPSTLDAALAWPQAKHLHIAEYATLHEMPELVRRAKAHGLSVSLDPSWDDALIRSSDLLDHCEGVDVFLPNLSEASAITGEDDPRRMLDILASSFPVVAIKAGGDGAYVGGRTIEPLHAPARQVRLVDTTGAGDAFNAGFIDRWLEDAPIRECLTSGIDAGALAIQAAGGAGILMEEIARAN